MASKKNRKSDKKQPALFDEVAAVGAGQHVADGYLGEIAKHEDSILALKGGDLAAYEPVLRDDQVKSTLEQRRSALISAPLVIEPGGSGRQDKKAADFVRENIEHLLFNDTTTKMHYGIFYGYAVGELMYGIDGRHLFIDDIKVRKQKRFMFGKDGTLRLKVTGKPGGEIMPERKFWTFATGADNDDNPYGMGLAYWLYWPVFFKRNDIKFWLIFLEKFGAPTVKGEYPLGAGETDRKKLLEACEAIRNATSITVPAGMPIELIEASRSGTADYRELSDRMDKAISKVVLCQTMTTDDGASLSQAQEHADVKQDVVRADADLLNDSLRRGPLSWLVGWNYPGASVPHARRVIEEPEDLKARAERDKIIFDMGYRPTLKYIINTYGGEWTDISANEPESTSEPTPAIEFGEGEPGPDLPFTEQLDEQTAEAMDGLIEDVKQLVLNATSLEGLRDRLLGLYGSMDPTKLGTMIERALLAAELAGRFDIVDGS